jgi:phosphoribosyl 1,2-cyclic phosphodiesterase
MLSGCAAIVLECNYDPGMLASGPYPQWLKERIGGPLGHLANAAAAEILAAIDRSRLQHVIAAHLSQTNNLPGLAAAALSGALGCAPDEITLADQAQGFSWRSL